MSWMRRATLAAVAGAVLSGDAAAGARQQAVFRGGTSAVVVDVAVRDGNRPVLDLEARDFVVHDNGVRQTVDVVSIDAVPVDVTLFLGSSDLSFADQIGDLSADLRRMASLLRPNDRVRLLTLENRVADAFGWRGPGDPIAAMNARVGGVQTLYDALFVGLMHKPGPDRRHLVIAITDGVEFGSVVDATTVREVARRADGVLHVVFVGREMNLPASVEGAHAADPRIGLDRRSASGLLVPQGGFSFIRATWFHVAPDAAGLERLAEATALTGGTARAVPGGTAVLETFRRAFEDFRQSYVLIYRPEGVPAAGWHEVQVELTNGRKGQVRARRGYFGS